MKKVNISFYVRDGQVVLAEMKRGPQAGCDNGYGGKMKNKDANIFHTAAREDGEEGGVKTNVEDMECIAHIVFRFGGIAKFEAFVFRIHRWQGEHIETEEMGPPVWHHLDRLPLDRMWPGDRLWVPEVLGRSRSVDGFVNYTQDGKTVDSFEFADVSPAHLRDLALAAVPDEHTED